MKILFAAAEAAPFVKTGGLADVIGALPKALRQSGHDVRIVLPKYQEIPQSFTEMLMHRGEVIVPVGWRQQYCGIEELIYEGIPVYMLDNEYYFRRDGIYGHYDDGERFAFLNRAVLEILETIDFAPDILHCHDWHTAMIPLFLQAFYRDQPFYKGIHTVFTIHNLLYQGLFPEEVLGDLLGLPYTYYTPDGVEYNGCVSFMKAGLQFSEHVTTVSPTYAEEIKTPFYGYGLDGLLRSLGGRLSGIVNGIDTKLYNPATDSALAVRYKTSQAKKKENKIHLQRELKLIESPDVPLIGMVTRLVEPKGLHLVMAILDEFLQQEEVQMVVLGTGDWEFEEW